MNERNRILWTGENSAQIEAFVGHPIDLNRVEQFTVHNPSGGDIVVSIGDILSKDADGNVYRV